MSVRWIWPEVLLDTVNDHCTVLELDARTFQESGIGFHARSRNHQFGLDFPAAIVVGKTRGDRRTRLGARQAVEFAAAVEDAVVHLASAAWALSPPSCRCGSCSRT